MTATNRYRLSIKNQLAELSRLQSCLDDFFRQNHLSTELAIEMMLISEELLANTISYGYNDDDEHIIDIEMSVDQQSFSMTILDDARAFNPLQQQAPEMGLPAVDTAIGGLGIPLIRALSDLQHYQRRDNRNVFIFTKLLITDN